METQHNHDAVHYFFGLSYANYLVVPRSVLQSMPDEWQTKFVQLLEEMTNTVEWDEPMGTSYSVKLRNERGQFLHDEYLDYERGRRKLPLKK